MKPLFTELDFLNAKSTDKLPCKCYCCNKTFYWIKKDLKNAMKSNHTTQAKYCSHNCANLFQTTKKEIKCTNCNKLFLKQVNQINKSKTNNHFCSKSCAAKYNNTHKITGNRRSKLEKYLEVELTKLYPNLKILFNDKTTINSELDIYIPSLKLAFELNGIFHYEPIFGNNKLSQIQNNDQRKFQACIEQGIELCIIDTSYQKYFKEQTAKKFLLIIINVLNSQSIDKSIV